MSFRYELFNDCPVEWAETPNYQLDEDDEPLAMPGSSSQHLDPVVLEASPQWLREVYMTALYGDSTTVRCYSALLWMRSSTFA